MSDVVRVCMHVYMCVYVRRGGESRGIPVAHSEFHYLRPTQNSLKLVSLHPQVCFAALQSVTTRTQQGKC